MQPWERGNKSEAAFTKDFHQTGTPVLVSSLVLRARDCGQVDCAKLEQKSQVFQDKILQIKEVKANHWVSQTQQRRLLRSADFLSKIFSCRSTISFAFGQNGIAKKQKLH